MAKFIKLHSYGNGKELYLNAELVTHMEEVKMIRDYATKVYMANNEKLYVREKTTEIINLTKN